MGYETHLSISTFLYGWLNLSTIQREHKNSLVSLISLRISESPGVIGELIFCYFRASIILGH